MKFDKRSLKYIFGTTIGAFLFATGSSVVAVLVSLQFGQLSDLVFWSTVAITQGGLTLGNAMLYKMRVKQQG